MLLALINESKRIISPIFTNLHFLNEIPKEIYVLPNKVMNLKKTLLTHDKN